MAFLVPFVAKDRGFYLKHGSEVELIVMRPNIAMAALLGGDIDYAELIGSIIRSAARNLPVRAISTSIKAPFFSIVGQNKFKTVKDLKGMVIGLTSIGGTNHVSTRMTLRQFGLDIDKDVKILAIGEEKLMVDTFKMGRVDAIVVWHRRFPCSSSAKASRFWRKLRIMWSFLFLGSARLSTGLKIIARKSKGC